MDVAPHRIISFGIPIVAASHPIIMGYGRCKGLIREGLFNILNQTFWTSGRARPDFSHCTITADDSLFFHKTIGMNDVIVIIEQKKFWVCAYDCVVYSG